MRTTFNMNVNLKKKERKRGGEEMMRVVAVAVLVAEHRSLIPNALLHTSTRNSHTNPGTEAEPQQIVAQRLLSCLQYPVPIESSIKDLTRPALK